MTYDLLVSKKTASGVVGVVAILFYFWLLTWSAPLHATPGFVAGVPSATSQAEPARIYRRGRTPVYPYKYNPPGRLGYSSYFGFVPYSKGDIENQALQRNFYPQNSWPHSNTAPPPNPWGN